MSTDTDIKLLALLGWVVSNISLKEAFNIFRIF